MKRLALLCLTGALASPLADPTLFHEQARAQRITPMQTDSFARICSRPTGHSLCDAYLSGLADGATLSKLNSSAAGDTGAVAAFCVPVSETTASIRDKVLVWLKAHTDALSHPVGESIFKALHDTYPCGAKP